MTNELTTSGGLRKTMLTTAISLCLASPVFASDHAPASPKAADNSAQNETDANGERVTPLDQSDADTDVNITRAIRKQLVDDDTLSTNARNVKVITINGVVTLRGPVETTAEQARIVAIAKDAAGMDRVANELDVITR